MGEGNARIEDRYKQIFPGLADDKFFKITSPQTSDYNCIAWAYNYNNRWMEPPNGYPLPFDGVTFWPDDVAPTLHPSALMELFTRKGYKVCDTWEHEDGYQKIALYYNPASCEWTHAARELTQKPNIGKWTSKLGQEHDIMHGTPYTIEGSAYGKVFCIMKREFK